MADSVIRHTGDKATAMLTPDLMPEDFLNGGGELLAKGLVNTIKSTDDRSMVSFRVNDRLLFCKMYRERGLFAAVRRCLRSSRAEQSHNSYLILGNLDCRVPQSFGFLFYKASWLDVKSYHVCEYLHDSESLLEYYARIHAGAELYIKPLALMLATLHRNGYVHGDTKLKNIILAGDKLYFVDLDGFGKSNFIRSPARDVARLIVGLSEAGLPSSRLNQLVDEYVALLNLQKDVLVRQLLPIIDRIQRRHKKKYNRDISRVDFDMAS